MTEMVKIIKRDGYMAEYDCDKIITAICKAMSEGETGVDEELAKEIEQEIHDEITNEFHQTMFTVESIQDMIEDGLMKNGRFNTAKRFIRYRAKREEERNRKWEMTDLQHDIWSQKYEWEHEGFEGWLDRVSAGNQEIKKLIRQKKFLFGGRILASRGLQNLGRKITFSNCYVITPPEDNIESIFESGAKLARTFSYGGGCGMDIGKLRPSGSKVNNAALTTSGSTSFMELYSTITSIIGQKGRRGALMLSMPIGHPDIEEFIDIKKDLNKVTKANISIRLTDEFMNAVKNNEMFKLKFYTKENDETIEKNIDAKKLFMKFAESNWDMAEPGALWWSRISNYNLLSEDDRFEFAGVNPLAN